jgi:hypothetical protein
LIVGALMIGELDVGGAGSYDSGWETETHVGSGTSTSVGSKVDVDATTDGFVVGRSMTPSLDFFEDILLVEFLHDSDSDDFLEEFDDPFHFLPLPN